MDTSRCMQAAISPSRIADGCACPTPKNTTQNPFSFIPRYEFMVCEIRAGRRGGDKASARPLPIGSIASLLDTHVEIIDDIVTDLPAKREQESAAAGAAPQRSTSVNMWCLMFDDGAALPPPPATAAAAASAAAAPAPPPPTPAASSSTAAAPPPPLRA